MWGGPQGPIQAGHFDKPFYEIRAGETQVVYAQSGSENARQGAAVERVQAGKDRAAGLFVRNAKDSRDPSWTGPSPKHPPVQDAFKSEQFRNWKPGSPPPSQSAPPTAAPAAPKGPAPQQLDLPFDEPPQSAPPPAKAPAPPPVVVPGPLTRVGNVAVGVTRTVVPGVAEAEVGLLGAAVYAHAAGHAQLAAALQTGSTAVPVVGAGLVTGSIVGNLAEEGATSLGASTATAQGAGALAAALSGAGVGALVGSAAGGVGAVPGAIVGGLAGLGGYYLSKMW